MHKPAILFLTNSELGQASVVLAVAHELVQQSDVLVASFPALKTHADALSVPFHALPGRSMKETLADSGLPYLPQHPPGRQGAVESYRNGLQRVVAPWEPEGYASIYRACLDLISKLSPALVVVEPLFGPGQDACNVLQQRYLVLSPATFKDHLVQAQPYLGVLWKYPVISSGLPYPIPLRSIALNIYLIFKLVTTTLLSPPVKDLTQWRNKTGIPGELTTIYANFNEKAPWIVPSIPQSDFPMYIPPNITGCGPILPPFEAIPDDHPTAVWLAQRPTILFNLGSHMKYTVEDAQQVIAALDIVLTKYPNVQVLWKCQLSTNNTTNTNSSETTITSLIPKRIYNRILITPWLTPSPASILAHQNTITAVHHGGSNSFHEALAAGVAQVVCPVWLDTYDFAARVEFLGVGVRGNVVAAPGVEGGELGRAICLVMDGGDAMGEKAREVQACIAALEDRCGDVYGVGRRRAARVILDLVE